MQRTGFWAGIGGVFTVLFFNSCFLSECYAPDVRPVNVTATVGEGQVSLSWGFSGYDHGVNTVYSEVRYAQSGRDCSSRNLKEGCIVACPLSKGLTECLVSGLSGDTAYAFTVLTVTVPSTIDCQDGYGSAQLDSIVPTAVE
jgi:hypothetical protein